MRSKIGSATKSPEKPLVLEAIPAARPSGFFQARQGKPGGKGTGARGRGGSPGMCARAPGGL